MIITVMGIVTGTSVRSTFEAVVVQGVTEVGE